MQRKPESYTKLQYENAQIYTNAMMDSYMSYKSLYTRLGSDIFDVQQKTKNILPWAEDATLNDGDEAATDGSSTAHSTTKFPATISGLAQAKKAIRLQMALIVNEVDAIEKNPIEATKPDHAEPFQDPTTFSQRLPDVKSPEKPSTSMPLSGKRIVAKTQTENEHASEQENEETQGTLIDDQSALTQEEQKSLDTFSTERPFLAKHLKLTPPLGSTSKGDAFNNLEFLQPHWKMTKLAIEIKDGALQPIAVHYDNGLILCRGKERGGRKVELTDFRIAERIISATIQVGKALDRKSEAENEPPKDEQKDKPVVEHQVIGIQLHTNRGRTLVAQTESCDFDKDRGHKRNGFFFTDVQTKFIDVPLKAGSLKGLFGRANDNGIWRLGFIWGDLGRVSIVYQSVQEASKEDANKSKQDDGFDGFVDSSPAGEVDPITTAMAEVTRCNAEIESLKAQRAQYTKEVESLNSRQLQWGGRPASYRRDRIEIFEIVYGGRLVWNDQVGQRLIDYALRREAFQVNDSIMGGDPWYGVRKSMTVVYRLDGKGELRCLVGRQDENIAFDRD